MPLDREELIALLEGGKPVPIDLEGVPEPEPLKPIEATENPDGPIDSVLGGIVGGTADFVRNTSDTLGEVLTGEKGRKVRLDGAGRIAGVYDSFGGRWTDFEEDMGIKTPGLTAGLTRGLTTASLGFLATRNVLSGANILEKRKWLQAALAGAVGDAVFVDPREGRLADVLLDNDIGANNAVVQFLASDPSDTSAEGRLKNALEGLGIGLAIDAAMLGALKSLRGMRNAQIKRSLSKEPLSPEQLADYKATQKAAVDTLEAALKKASGTLEDEITLTPSEVAERTSLLFKPTLEEADQVRLRELNAKATGDEPVTPMGTDRPVAKSASGEPDGPRVSVEGPPRYTGQAARSGIDHSRITSEIDYDQALGLLKAADEVDLEDGAKVFNFARLDTLEDGARMIRAIADDPRFVESLAKLDVDGRKSLEEVIGEASGNLTEADPTAFLREQRQLSRNLAGLDAQVTAARFVFQAQANRVAGMVQEIDGLKASGKEVSKATWVQFLKHLNLLEELEGISKANQKNIARALGAHRITPFDAIGDDFLDKLAGKNNKQLKDLPAEGARRTEAEMDRLIESTGGQESLIRQAQRAIDKVRGKTKPSEIAQAAKKSFTRKFLDELAAYADAQILSGISTHQANILGNAVQTILLPTERAIGALMRGDLESSAAAFRTIKQTFGSLTDAARFAWKATKENGPVTLRNELRGAKFDRIQSRFAFVKNILNWPYRALQAGDEFFANLSYRAKVKADAQTAGIKKGLKGKDLEDFIEAENRQAFNSDGTANPDFAEAIEHAKRVTLQSRPEDLIEGFLRVIRPASQNPLVRLLGIKFVNVAGALFRESFRRSPGLNLLSHNFRRRLSGALGVVEQQSALGEVASSAMLMVGAYAYWKAGYITGAPPLDPEERSAWYSSGNQPYALRVGDTWLSYRRVEPMGTVLSFLVDSYSTAELAQAIEVSPGQWTTQWDKMGQKAVGTLIQATTNKTYLKQLSDLLGAITSTDEREWKQVVANMVGQFAPQGGLQRTISKVSEGQLFERNDPFTAEGFGRSLAGDFLGDQLFGGRIPRRNYFGEPVELPVNNALSPMPWYAADDSEASEELRVLARNIQPDAGLNDIKGVQLTPELKDQLHGKLNTVELGGKTFKQAFEDLIHSDRYQRAHPAEFFLDTAAPGTRQLLFRELRGRYVERAKAELLRESPELKDALRAVPSLKREARRGNPQAQRIRDLLEGE